MAKRNLAPLGRRLAQQAVLLAIVLVGFFVPLVIVATLEAWLLPYSDIIGPLALFAGVWALGAWAFKKGN
jgi:hypothetical protein